MTVTLRNIICRGITEKIIYRDVALPPAGEDGYPLIATFPARLEALGDLIARLFGPVTVRARSYVLHAGLAGQV
jgi:hypothetical protein